MAFVNRKKAPDLLAIWKKKFVDRKVPESAHSRPRRSEFHEEETPRRIN